MKLKDAFTQAGADFNTSPVIFRHKDKDLMAVSGNDGRLYLLDGASLKTPLFVTPKYSNAGATGGLATWENEGTRWILAPAVGGAQAGVKTAANGPVTNGSIVAFGAPSRRWWQAVIGAGVGPRAISCPRQRRSYSTASSLRCRPASRGRRM